MIKTKNYLPKLPFAELVEGGVAAPLGFTAAGVYCGVKRAGYSENTVTPDSILANKTIQNEHKPDLAMIFCEKECSAAAVFTQNLVKGAPILVSRQHLADHKARAVIVNSGNANTCNADGVDKAIVMCKLTAHALGINPGDVIVASTGVIGQVLPIEPIAAGVPVLADKLSRDGGTAAARAIMTTDTVEKQLAVSFDLGGSKVTIGAMSKGSGMIHPNMATMLGFITTDAAISGEMLDKALRAAAGDSFNMLSVDGDTSTNDTLAVMASGLAGNPEITEQDELFDKFTDALTAVCVSLARVMARDGEGATKLIECAVSGAADTESARKIAKSVICSPLLKSAMFGCDANWGRVLCAIGYSGAQVSVDKIDVTFVSDAGRLAVCKNGSGIDFSEDLAKVVLSCEDILIEVTARDGDACARAFGCDLTYDYVKINGDYRT